MNVITGRCLAHLSDEFDQVFSIYIDGATSSCSECYVVVLRSLEYHVTILSENSWPGSRRDSIKHVTPETATSFNC